MLLAFTSSIAVLMRSHNYLAKKKSFLSVYVCLVTLLRAATMFAPLSVTYNDFRKNSLVLGLGLVLGLVYCRIQKCNALDTSAPAGY